MALIADEGCALRALPANLSVDQQRILELRLAGLTGAAIARVLGRGETAVKMQQYRAIAQLRRRLGAHPQPQGAHHDQV